jgi:hypothetical protein
MVYYYNFGLTFSTVGVGIDDSSAIDDDNEMRDTKKMMSDTISS